MKKEIDIEIYEIFKNLTPENKQTILDFARELSSAQAATPSDRP